MTPTNLTYEACPKCGGVIAVLFRHASNNTLYRCLHEGYVIELDAEGNKVDTREKPNDYTSEELGGLLK